MLSFALPANRPDLTILRTNSLRRTGTTLVAALRPPLWFLAFLLSALLLGAAPVQAHQMKSAISKVLFNPRTGNLEVMHRFYLHDAEHAVKHLQHKKADLLNDAESRQHFADYVAQHFALRVILAAPTIKAQAMPPTVKPLQFRLLGAELDGRFIWVYQETPLPVQLPLQQELQLEVQHTSLMELWPSQVNAVNVEGAGLHDGAGKVRTVKLTKQQPTQRLTLYAGKSASPVKS